MKLFKAIIWDVDGAKPGQRVSIRANSLHEAKRKIETEYGSGRVYTLHNEEDASRLRSATSASAGHTAG